jgi:hypothetical protein
MIRMWFLKCWAGGIVRIITLIVGEILEKTLKRSLQKTSRERCHSTMKNDSVLGSMTDDFLAIWQIFAWRLANQRWKIVLNSKLISRWLSLLRYPAQTEEMLLFLFCPVFLKGKDSWVGTESGVLCTTSWSGQIFWSESTRPGKKMFYSPECWTLWRFSSWSHCAQSIFSNPEKFRLSAVVRGRCPVLWK